MRGILGITGIVFLIGTVDGVAQAPQPPSPVEFRVLESERPGTVVGQIKPLHATESPTDLRFELVSDGQFIPFQIDRRTGELIVSGGELDYEAQPRFEFAVRVRRPRTLDGAQRSFITDLLSDAEQATLDDLLFDESERRVVVHVEDANDAPVLEAQSLVMVVRGTGEEAAAYVAAQDPDRNDELVYELITEEPDRFAIDSRTGKLQWMGPADAATTIYPLTVRVTDASGASDAATIRVEVVVATPAEPAVLAQAAPEPAAADHPVVQTTEAEVKPAPADAPVETSVAPDSKAAAAAITSGNLAASKEQSGGGTPAANSREAATGPIWPWLLLGTALLTVVVAIPIWRLQHGLQRASDDDDELSTQRCAGLTSSSLASSRWLDQRVELHSAGVANQSSLSRPAQDADKAEMHALIATALGERLRTGAEPALPAADGPRENEPVASQQIEEPVVRQQVDEPVASQQIEEQTVELLDDPRQLVEQAPWSGAVGLESETYELPANSAEPEHLLSPHNSETPDFAAGADSEQEYTIPLAGGDFSDGNSVSEPAFDGADENFAAFATGGRYVSSPDELEGDLYSLQSRPFDFEDDDRSVAAAGATPGVEDSLRDSLEPAAPESSSEPLDERLIDLRRQLAEMFGVSFDAPPAAGRPEEAADEDDSTVTADEAMVTAEETLDAVDEVEPAEVGAAVTPVEESAGAAPDPVQSWLDYVKSRALEKPIAGPSTASLNPGASDRTPEPSWPAVDGEVRDVSPVQAARPLPLGTMPSAQQRMDKTAVREEISYLRELANRHTRSVLAHREWRQRARLAWIVWATSVVLLCILGQSAVQHASAIVRMSGWGMFAGATIALVGSLHGFLKLSSKSVRREKAGTAEIATDESSVMLRTEVERMTPEMEARLHSVLATERSLVAAGEERG